MNGSLLASQKFVKLDLLYILGARPNISEFQHAACNYEAVSVTAVHCARISPGGGETQILSAFRFFFLTKICFVVLLIPC